MFKMGLNKTINYRIKDTKSRRFAIKTLSLSAIFAAAGLFNNKYESLALAKSDLEKSSAQEKTLWLQNSPHGSAIPQY